MSARCLPAYACLAVLCTVFNYALAAQFLEGPLDTDGAIPYYISSPESGGESDDSQLALWALQAWQSASNGRITIQPSSESAARVRVYWSAPRGGQYGEMHPIEVAGKRGAAVFIRAPGGDLGPAISQLILGDPLFRDAVLYLTCLHELGHALGLSHTRDYDDIMYFFGFGGDIQNYFARYRQRLGSREDIRHHSGLSDSDVLRLTELYPTKPGH